MVELPRAAIIIFLLGLSLAGQAAPSLAPAPDWAHLTPAQQKTLQPLQPDWNNFEDVRKRKWIGIADRYPKMTPQEQSNVRERMQEWSKLTPQQRQAARDQYKRLQTIPSPERRQLEQKWKEYDALPPEKKQELQKARPMPPAAGSTPAVAPTARPPKPISIAPVIKKPKLPPSASAPAAEPQSAPAK